LAAVLLDAGQVDVARDIVTSALAAATDETARTVALDTLCGLSLIRGELDIARDHLDALAALGLPGGDLSRAFRAAQIHRLDGLGRAAEGAWVTLAASLGARPETAGPEGACWAELGELELLRH